MTINASPILQQHNPAVTPASYPNKHAPMKAPITEITITIMAAGVKNFVKSLKFNDLIPSKTSNHIKNRNASEDISENVQTEVHEQNRT